MLYYWGYLHEIYQAKIIKHYQTKPVVTENENKIADFRHHISLTPSRSEMVRMDRSMRPKNKGNPSKNHALETFINRTDYITLHVTLSLIYL